MRAHETKGKLGSVENLVWIDCEMTGLDLTTDALIEVAVLVTDPDLTILGDGVDVIIAPPDEALAVMSEFVTQMHSSSGLLDALASGMTMAEAENAVLAYVQQFVPEAGKAPLAGNSVGTDRTFLARDMPTLEGYLHYRNVDVSSIKELARRWYPRTFASAPAKYGNHRALGDIQDSINELRYYRQAIFVPQPGLSRDKARHIAAAYERNNGPVIS